MKRLDDMAEKDYLNNPGTLNYESYTTDANTYGVLLYQKYDPV